MNYRKTYKKRKAFHITIIAISVIAGLYFNMMLPGVVRDNVPCVDVIFPERTEYIPSVTCSGTVGYSQVRSIKEEIPLIIKEYLAVVDKQAVCDKLSNIYSGSVSDVLTAAELSDRIPEEIPALVSGTVCYLAKSGELIDAGADIARVGGQGARVLNVAVPERNLSKIRKGQTALLTLSSVDGKFAGQVKSIGKSTRKQYLGAVEETVADVMISIESPSDRLKSGDSGYAEIQTGLKRDIVTLPYSAVMQDEKSEYIYVIEDGRTTRRDVITGLELAKRTQVFGVSVEEEVVKSTQGVAANSIIIRNKTE